MDMGRKKLGIVVDEDTWNEFKSWVKDQYGFTRGVLASEVEKALKSHINPVDGRVTSDVNQSIPGSGIDPGVTNSTHTQKRSDEKDDLIDAFGEHFRSDEEIHRDDLETFIAGKEGLKDGRQVKGRITLLEGKGAIESVVKGKIYKNLILEAQKVNLMDDSYIIVKDYFHDNFNDRTITIEEMDDLPPGIRKELMKLDKSRYNEFVREV